MRAEQPSMSKHVIPRVNVSALFSGHRSEFSQVDTAISRAAQSSGMMIITDLPRWAALDEASRTAILKIFSLPDAEIRRLWRWSFDSRQRNVYRGWFPLQPG